MRTYFPNLACAVSDITEMSSIVTLTKKKKEKWILLNKIRIKKIKIINDSNLCKHALLHFMSFGEASCKKARLIYTYHIQKLFRNDPSNRISINNYLGGDINVRYNKNTIFFIFLL